MIVSYSDKANVVSDALSRKMRGKSRRVKGMILEAQTEVFKQENVLTERLHGLDPQMERKGDEPIEVQVGFRKKGKLTPRYVGPFEILERIGLEAYRLRLPEDLNNMHDTFHVSNLKKCLADANLHVPLDEIKVEKTLRFVKEPVEIMDQEIRKLKHRKVVLVKVRWNSKCGLEFTWEHEDQMRIKYPRLSVDRVVEPAS
ncbi:hypothetical protein Tco_0937778 [Tanacetum coccineum]|uniref:Tf2-1-like SH3-like domain-containing protein n=1 Tax=Tanacetum coccineum TaxID=301880 RepID=A0ABQ5DG65_9ASTR